MLTLVDNRVVVVAVVVVHSIGLLEEENKVLGLMEVVDKNRVVPTLLLLLVAALEKGHFAHVLSTSSLFIQLRKHLARKIQFPGPTTPTSETNVVFEHNPVVWAICFPPIKRAPMATYTIQQVIMDTLIGQNLSARVKGEDG